MIKYSLPAIQSGTFNSATESSVILNPSSAQNIPSMGLYGWDICLRNRAYHNRSTFKTQLTVTKIQIELNYYYFSLFFF